MKLDAEYLDKILIIMNLIFCKKDILNFLTLITKDQCFVNPGDRVNFGELSRTNHNVQCTYTANNFNNPDATNQL